MKKLIRTLSAILCMTMFMSNVIIAGAAESTLPQQKQNGESALEDAQIVGEVTEKRTADEKHFKMSDGSFTAVKYPVSVHYETDGVWEAIDNTLVRQIPLQTCQYINKNNIFNVTFAESISSQTLVKINYDGYEVAWGYSPENSFSGSAAPLSFTEHYNAVILPRIETKTDNLSVKQKNEAVINSAVTSSSVIYNNIEPGIDLEYKISGTSLKENFIINARRNSYAFTLTLKTGKLIPVLNENKSIDFIDDGRVVFTIPAPVMYDADMQYSDSLRYDIQRAGNGYTLTLTADADWINSPSRVFPVMIDPEISAETYKGSGAKMELQTVDSANPNMTFNTLCDADVSVSPSLIRRTYITLELPELQRGDVLSNVILKLNAGSDCNTSDYNKINLHELPEVYDGSTLCWNNMPEPGSNVVDFNMLQKSRDSGDTGEAYYYSDIGIYEFNITKLAQNWYNSVPYYSEYDPMTYTREKHSFVLKMEDESQNLNGWRRFHIYNQNVYNNAKLIVSYRNAIGYEDYWTYTSTDAGYGGTASVNCYNGDIHISQPITGISSEIMPISISMENLRYYNGTNNALIKGGWKTNYNISYNYESLNTDSTCSNYFIDGDGTKHYFYIPTGETSGMDEDGLGLTLQLLGTGGSGGDFAKITDQDGGVMIFNNKKQLRRIEDKYGNYINIEFGSSAYDISKITNSVGHEYTFSYLPQSSNISSITDSAGKTVYFDYENDLLSQIRYPDGKTVNYVYNEYDEIVQITNYDSTKTLIQYEDSMWRKVTQLKKVNSEQTAVAGSFDFEYDYHTTYVTDKYNQSVEYQFDNYGNLTGTIDKDTGNVSYGTSGIQGLTANGDSTNPTAHKPMSLSSSMQATPSLLDGGGFDDGFGDV